MILQSFDRHRLLHWGRLIGLWFCISVRIRPSLSEEMADIVNDRWNVQYIFARGVKGQVEVELKVNTDDFCTGHLIAYLLFASLVGFTTTKIKEIGYLNNIWGTTPRRKKSFLPKWGKLFLTLYWSEDWYWLELSCLILFGFQPYSSSVMKRKGRFCQPGLPMKFYICRWLGHLPVFFFLSVLDGRALKKNTLHYQIWITKFQFDWRSILNTPQVISKSRPQHIIGRNGSGSCSAVRCLPLDGCVTIDNSESGKVCDPDQEPSAGNSFLNRTQN